MTDKIGLSQKNIDYLRSAFAHFFPEDTVYIDEPFSSGNFNWKNRKDFIEFINYRLLKGVVFIESEKDIENIKKAQLEIEKLITEGTEQKIPDPNTLTPKELEELIRKSQQTETEREEIRNEGEKKVKEAITKKEELFQKQKAWEKLQQQKISTLPEQSQEQILLELKEKTIYATPTTPTPVTNLTEKELKLIKILIKIAKNDPETFTQKLSSLIIKKNPDIPLETLEPLSKIIAVETTQTLVNPGNKIVPTGVFVALTNTPKVVKGLKPTTQSEIIKTALIFTALSEEQDNLYRTVLIRSLGENLTNNVLGPPQREFILTLDSKEGSFVVNLNQLQENSFDFQSNETFQNFLNNPLFSDTQSIVSNELNKFALEKIRSFSGKGVLSEVSNFTTSRAFDSIAPFLGVETSFSYVGKSFFGKTIVKIYPQYAPLITNIAGRLGVDIGIAVVAPVAKEAVVKTGGAVVAKEAVTKVVGKVGLKGVLTKITTALSTAIPIPGINWIIGIIGGELIGKIIEKIPWKKIAKWSAAIIGGVMFLITLPFLGFGKAVFIGFSSAGLSTFFGGNLGGLTFSGVVKKASKITIKAGLSTLKILGLYILATVFGLSVLVALILFIINSGAYIVPPTIDTMFGINPYIKVEKMASPQGPFENSDLPITITYSVIITPRRETLTNITIEDNCLVVNNKGTSDCPSNLPSDIPETISPGSSYSFTYEETYSGLSYNDSLVINTITVKANVVDAGEQESVGSVSITIGKPPTDCLEINPNEWPSEYYTNIIYARSLLVSKYGNFVSKICSSYPKITLNYTPTPYGNYWGWNRKNSILFYPKGVKNMSDALYTLTHELGHSFAWGSNTAQFYQLYLEKQGIKNEAPYCFYNATINWDRDESLPEVIALYVIEPRCGSVQSKWPIHYEFLMQYVFN